MFHTIIVAGNIGRDPEMRFTAVRRGCDFFSVATSRNTAMPRTTVKETIWFRISCWSKLAEYANNSLKKGNKVLIEGRTGSGFCNGRSAGLDKSDGTTSALVWINAVTIRSLTPVPTVKPVPEPPAVS